MTLEYGIAAAAVSKGWATYLKDFLDAVGIDNPGPDWLYNDVQNDEIAYSVFAVVIVAICMLIDSKLKDFSRPD